MVENIRKYRTSALAQASIFIPSNEIITASIETVSRSIGKKLNQDDLMYIKAVLVTTGINGNDDCFLIDEMWQARNSPVLKPLNWMHNNSSIIGVMYSSTPYDLQGKKITASSWEDPFELVIEGAVYKLTFADKAQEIEELAKANKLFVSMESWFDNYDYAFYNGNNLEKLVQRDSSTAFLDPHLKAKSGTGYVELEGQKYRIGRALRNLIFGGCGFVKIPANQRSYLLEVGDSGADTESSASIVDDGNIEAYLKSILSTEASNKPHSKSIFVFSTEVNKEDIMADSNKELSLSRGDLHVAISDTLNERERSQAAQAETNALRTQAEKLTAEKDKLTQTVATLTAELDAAKTENASMTKAVNELTSEIAEALAEAPPEIARIDSVTDGDSAFQAKIAWIQESTAGLLEKACAAVQLERDLAEAKTLARSNEVAKLFSNLGLSEAELKVFQDKAGKMDDITYAEWLVEKKVILGARGANLVGDYPVPSRPGGGKEVYTQEDLGNDVQVGKGPGSVPAPRHKISGGKTAEDVLENVDVEKGPNLAGANNKAEAAEKDPVVESSRSLAALVYGTVGKKNKAEASEKPKFDPIEK